jgi:cytochrome c5
MRRRSKVVLAITVLFLLAMTAAIAGCASGAPGPEPTQASASAAPDGASLLQERCSVCHSSDMSTHPGKTRDAWDRTVSQMIGKGAKLTEDEKTVLVDYLAATFGP